MSTMHKIKEFFGFEEDEQQALPVKNTQSSNKPFKAPSIMLPSKHVQHYSEIRVEEPKIYEDSLNIATNLRENKPIIVNLKHLDSDAGKRLIDFICGTAYAINGHMIKVADNIFLFTPAHISIGHSNKNDLTESEPHESNIIQNL